MQLFAAQAAVAITNARLYEQLRNRVDAQRSLAEIAAQIAALHEPLTVIERAVADAARLLRADRAQINLLGERDEQLERPIAAAPVPPSPDDVWCRSARGSPAWRPPSAACAGPATTSDDRRSRTTPATRASRRRTSTR